MAEIDPQLVTSIADQVLAALRRNETLTSAPSPPPDELERPRFAPALGTCTGDYSKFTDRPDLTDSSESPTSQYDTPSHPSGHIPSLDAEAGSAAASCPVLWGIITARQLEDTTRAASGGRVAIAADARLSPLAQDFAKAHPHVVQRLKADAPRQGSSAFAARGPMGLRYWIDGHCPAARTAIEQAGPGLTPIAASARGDEVLRVIRELAGIVAAGQSTGGLLFVRHGALATVAANRCRSLRAVSVNNIDALDHALTSVGVNVLIIEYPLVSSGRIGAIVERFVGAAPRVAPLLENALAELHRSTP